MDSFVRYSWIRYSSAIDESMDNEKECKATKIIPFEQPYF